MPNRRVPLRVALPEKAQHWPLRPPREAARALPRPLIGGCGACQRWFPDCIYPIENGQHITKGPPALSFRIYEPYDVALRMVRIALSRQGLRAPAELDIAGRIRKELGAGVAPCIVLYIDDPAVLLEAVVFNRGAGLLIPQPLVVTGDSSHTEVLVRSPELPAGDIPESVREPLLDLQVRMARAIETIADREGAHLTISS